DINAGGGHCSNTLQAASYGTHTEVVKLLLEKRADINAEGGRYGSALQTASSRGQTEAVRLLKQQSRE
ncbi:hypothetical protein K469DRAFT_813253, partial [Zopfia rhizophila CBS 207.26]